MTASHVAGSGLGALVGAILVSLGTRIGLDLTNFDSATVGIAAVGVGLGLGHAIGHAGATVGVFPAIRRFLFGPGPIRIDTYRRIDTANVDVTVTDPQPVSPSDLPDPSNMSFGGGKA